MAFGNAWGHDGVSCNGKDMRALAQSLGYGITYAVMGQPDMAVTAQTTPANTVRVAAGRAIVQATGAGLGFSYHAWNDGFVTSPTFTATGADPRTDRVIIRVVAGVPAVQIVAGTPGPGTPPPPTVTGDNYMVLARVQIPAATSTVTNAMIVDERIVVGQPPSRVLSAALPFLSPSAGDINYEPDTGRVNVYHGGVWRPPVYHSGGSLGIARIGADQSGLGPSLVDLAGMSVTVDVPYPNRRIKITGHTMMSLNTAATFMTGHIREGSTTLGRYGWFNSGAAFERTLFEGSVYVDNPTVGSHTYKLSIQSQAGSTFSHIPATTSDTSWIEVADAGSV